MKNLPFKRTHLSLMAAALLLAACGDGGGGSGVADPLIAGTDVPTSASTSSAGAFAFVNTVVSTSDDSAEPLVAGDTTLATSDTDEPEPII